MSVASAVREIARNFPDLMDSELVLIARDALCAPWLDGHEVRRILDRKPKGACPLTPQQIERGMRMRDEGATWPEIAAALHCDRHTASKYVRAAQQARGQR